MSISYRICVQDCHALQRKKKPFFRLLCSSTNQGLAVLENDSTFLTAKEECATYAPVSLDSVVTISEDKQISWEQEQTDVFGNTYSVCYKATNYCGTHEPILEKYLNKNYSRFEAIYAPTSKWGYSNEYMKLSVYGDGQLLASYDLYYNTLPVDISVNVSNVDILRLVIKNYKGTYSSNVCYVLLAEPTVTK